MIKLIFLMFMVIVFVIPLKKFNQISIADDKIVERLLANTSLWFTSDIFPSENGHKSPLRTRLLLDDS